MQAHQIAANRTAAIVGTSRDQEMPGGPRACALDAAQTGGNAGVESNQATTAAGRSSLLNEDCGSAVGVAVCAALHSVQQPPCDCCGSVCPSCEEDASVVCEQMAPASGSDAA